LWDIGAARPVLDFHIEREAMHATTEPENPTNRAAILRLWSFSGQQATYPGRRRRMKPVIAGLILMCAASASAQKLTVKIINRQDNDTDYTYVVPGYFNSQSNSNVNCNGGDNSVNCNGSTSTTGLSMPAQQVPYHVRGATFTLQLPDGRAAVVNCESKFKERMAGPRGNRRSCRIPLVDDIQAEFHGDNAKLEWVVSLDGKKTRSETYKILAILDKLKSDHN
jgi:hypothetical protein